MAERQTQGAAGALQEKDKPAGRKGIRTAGAASEPCVPDMPAAEQKTASGPPGDHVPSGGFFRAHFYSYTASIPGVRGSSRMGARRLSLLIGF